MNKQIQTGLVAIAFVAIVASINGCNLPDLPTACPDGVVCSTNTPEPTSAISATPDVGNTAEPSETPTASVTPYPTLIPTSTLSPELYTPTAIAPCCGDEELLDNHDFEDGFRTVIVGDCSELGEDGKPACDAHIVAQDWQIAYLAPHSHYELVAPLDPNSEIPQGRPEAKPMDIPSRVHSGSLAQYAFCAYETCTVACISLSSLPPAIPANSRLMSSYG